MMCEYLPPPCGMTLPQRHETIRKVLDDIKGTSFSVPASDADAMGLLVSQYFGGDARAVIRAAAIALEDSNAHELAGYLFRRTS